MSGAATVLGVIALVVAAFFAGRVSVPTTARETQAIASVREDFLRAQAEPAIAKELERRGYPATLAFAEARARKAEAAQRDTRHALERCFAAADRLAGTLDRSYRAHLAREGLTARVSHEPRR